MGCCLCNLRIRIADGGKRGTVCPKQSRSTSALRSKAGIIISMILVDANARNAVLAFTATRNDTLNLLLCGEVLNLKSLWQQQRISHPAFLRLTKNLLQTIGSSHAVLSIRVRTLLRELEFEFDKDLRDEKMLQTFAILEQELLDDLVHMLPLFERSREFAEYIQYKSIPCESFHAPISLEFSRSLSDPGIPPPSFLMADRRRCFHRILVVDGTPIISKILICGLLHHFDRVFHAINEAEALDCLLSLRTFDYVLFNFDINDKGGINVLKSFKAMANETCVPFSHFIGMASNADSVYLDTALNLGFSMNIVMPFNHNDVVDSIQQLRI